MYFDFYESDGVTPRSVLKYGGASATTHAVSVLSVLDLHDLGSEDFEKCDYWAFQLDVSSLPSWDSTAGDPAAYIKCGIRVHTTDGTTHATYIGQRALIKAATNPKIVYIDPAGGTDAAGRGTVSLPLATLEYATNNTNYRSQDYDLAYVKPGTEQVATLSTAERSSASGTKHMTVKPWPGQFSGSQVWELSYGTSATAAGSGSIERFMAFVGGTDKRIKFSTTGSVDPGTAGAGAIIEFSIADRYIAAGTTHQLGSNNRGFSYLLKIKNNTGGTATYNSLAFSAQRGVSCVLTFPSTGFATFTIGTPPVSVAAGATFLCRFDLPSTTGGYYDSDVTLNYTPSGGPATSLTITLQGYATQRVVRCTEHHYVFKQCVFEGETRSIQSLSVQANGTNATAGHISIIGCDFSKMNNMFLCQTLQGGDIIIHKTDNFDSSGTQLAVWTASRALLERMTQRDCCYGETWRLGEDGSGTTTQHRNTWNTASASTGPGITDIIYRYGHSYNNGDPDGSRNTDGNQTNVMFSQHSWFTGKNAARIAIYNNTLCNAGLTQAMSLWTHGSSSDQFENIIFSHNTMIQYGQDGYASGFLFSTGDWTTRGNIYQRNNVINNFLGGTYGSQSTTKVIAGVARRNYATAITYTTDILTAAGTSQITDLKLSGIRSGDPTPDADSPLFTAGNEGVPSAVRYDHFMAERSLTGPTLGAIENEDSSGGGEEPPSGSVYIVKSDSLKLVLQVN